MDDQTKHLIALGKSHYRAKEYDKAEQCLSEVVKSNQSFADVYNMLGVIYHHQGESDKAQGAFEAAIRLNPGYTEAALNLAVVYNDKGLYEEAKSVYGRAVVQSKRGDRELDPFVLGKIANMYADIGDVFATSGLWERAVREYANALELCPDFVDIRMRMAAALRDAGEKERAVAELERAIESRPEYLPARVALGVALFSAGRLTDAVDCWRAVLAVNPDEETAKMYIRLVQTTEEARGGSDSRDD